MTLARHSAVVCVWQVTGDSWVTPTLAWPPRALRSQMPGSHSGVSWQSRETPTSCDTRWTRWWYIYDILRLSDKKHYYQYWLAFKVRGSLLFQCDETFSSSSINHLNWLSPDIHISPTVSETLSYYWHNINKHRLTRLVSEFNLKGSPP